MKTTGFSDFRQHAAAILDQVESGETFRILRHGKPVADLTPVAKEGLPSWKKPPPRLSISGASLSRAILQNRREADLFVSGDGDQIKAAKKAGLAVKMVG